MLQPVITGTKDVSNKVERLPNIVCDEVLLELPNLLNDEDKTVLEPDAGTGYTTTGNHIYYGFNGAALHQLFVTGSIRIQVTNLKEIWIRGENPPEGQYIVFSCFQESNK